MQRRDPMQRTTRDRPRRPVHSRPSLRRRPGRLTRLLAASAAILGAGVAPAQQTTSTATSDYDYRQQTPEQLEQLAAPIALYPDSLVAQILAASTFPVQVVEADRWLKTHPGLAGEALAREVDQQPWDPSVKALTAFPDVIGNMDQNIGWTSSLGDAYYNQQQDVIAAVQRLRQRAMQAGTLRTTPQQSVSSQGSTIVIQSASPSVVYVPAYNPWIVYGGALAPWPGWYAYPGIWYAGPSLSFGIGFGIGPFLSFGWGWPYWGFNWPVGVVVYRSRPYHSRTTIFYNRHAYYSHGGFHGVEGALHGRRPQDRPGPGPGPGPGPRPGGRDGGRGGDVFNRPGGSTHPFGGDGRAARGWGGPAQPRAGSRSGVFSGYGNGGEARSYSSRGRQSMGGGPGESGRPGGGFGGARPGGGAGGHGGGRGR